MLESLVTTFNFSLLFRFSLSAVFLQLHSSFHTEWNECHSFPSDWRAVNVDALFTLNPIIWRTGFSASFESIDIDPMPSTAFFFDTFWWRFVSHFTNFPKRLTYKIETMVKIHRIYFALSTNRKCIFYNTKSSLSFFCDELQTFRKVTKNNNNKNVSTDRNEDRIKMNWNWYRMKNKTRETKEPTRSQLEWDRTENRRIIFCVENTRLKHTEPYQNQMWWIYIKKSIICQPCTVDFLLTISIYVCSIFRRVSFGFCAVFTIFTDKPTEEEIFWMWNNDTPLNVYVCACVSVNVSVWTYESVSFGRCVWVWAHSSVNKCENSSDGGNRFHCVRRAKDRYVQQGQ